MSCDMPTRARFSPGNGGSVPSGLRARPGPSNPDTDEGVDPSAGIGPRTQGWSRRVPGRPVVRRVQPDDGQARLTDQVTVRHGSSR
jgi:hypothetical protein